MSESDPFNSKKEFALGGHYYSLDSIDESGIDTSSLPYSVRVLLEGALRNCDGFLITENDVKNTQPGLQMVREEKSICPSRVILQDFTGVPAVVDLAALRDAGRNEEIQKR